MNYESVLALIDGLTAAASDGQRDVKWTTRAQVVGVARDHAGHVEVFLAGDELNATSSKVAEALDFYTWHRDGAPSFDANRILLPPFGYFDQVAAFICTELLRNGADASLSSAFAQTEPIIELAIERLRISSDAIVGLAGELLFLHALVGRAADAQLPSVIDSWFGWRRSGRDFVLGSTGIEVKTTRGPASSHFIEGVHQVEKEDGSGGGAAENKLYLISIGLQTGNPGGAAFTIPQLVNRIDKRLEDSGNVSSVSNFLGNLKQYASATGDGYDHSAQASDPAYTVPFLTTFFRAYDMSDPAIEVLRRHDITAHHHVDVGSVRFRVDLPLTASAKSPIVGANQVAAAILGEV